MAEDDYNYKKAYLREKSARDQLETLLEDKTRALVICWFLTVSSFSSSS